MLSREEMLLIFDRAYEARCSGDRAAVERFLAPGATYSLNGDYNALAGFPQGASPAPVTIAGLMEQFQFHSVVRIDALVEGDRAAFRARVVVSTGHGDPVTTEILDLWTFDRDGRVASIVQYADTELVAWMAAGRAGGAP